MKNNELQAAIAAALQDVGYECDLDHLRPGYADHLAGDAQWMGILDDRTPGSDGPPTFDGPELAKMLRSTILMVLDLAPEPDRDAYEFLARATAFGNRVFIVQTTASRRDAWRNFIRARRPELDVAEIVPVEGSTNVSGRLTFFRRPERAMRTLSAASRYAGWETPWGPAIRLTRIAAGIEFYETATAGCYRLTPACNAAVPQAWRNVAVSQHVRERWYCEQDAPLVMLAFPEHFGEKELAHARAKFAVTFAPKIAAAAVDADAP